MRIGLNASSLLTTPNIEDMRAHATQAEQDGFSSWWLAQTGLVDALGMIGALASSAPSLEYGTAVVPTYSRHPSTMAGQALTAQAALNRPLALGIGLSHQPVVEDRMKMEWQKPMGHIRDYLNVLEPLLETGTANHDGTYFSMHYEGPRPTEQKPSVIMAALGPQMLKLCGQRADGTILWMVGERTIAEHIAPTINAAATDAARPNPRIICSLPTAVTSDPDSTRAAHGAIFELYGQLPSYRAMLDREGAAGPQDVCVIGSEDEVHARLDALAAAGTTDFAALELGISPEDMARTRALLKERG